MWWPGKEGRDGFKLARFGVCRIKGNSISPRTQDRRYRAQEARLDPFANAWFVNLTWSGIADASWKDWWEVVIDRQMGVWNCHGGYIQVSVLVLDGGVEGLLLGLEGFGSFSLLSAVLDLVQLPVLHMSVSASEV